MEADRPSLLPSTLIFRADLANVLRRCAIYLLEPDDPDRAVTLPFDNGAPVGRELRLPPNLYLLGTMNSADRSIAILDLAVRRRFAFVPLWPDRAVLEECGASSRMVEAFERLLELFLEQAGDEALSLIPGHAYFLDRGRDPQGMLSTGLKPLLLEYLAQGFVAGFADDLRAYLEWLG